MYGSAHVSGPQIEKGFGMTASLEWDFTEGEE